MNEPTTPAVESLPPPDVAAALSASWATFQANAKFLIQAFGIFIGTNLLIAVFLGLIAHHLSSVLQFLLMAFGTLPSILLLPGLYSICLKCVRGQKAELGELLLLFRDRFIHHVGLLLLQVCGVLVCFVGVIVTTAFFVPGAFLVIDRKFDWDGAMERCVQNIKPKPVPWIVFSLVMCIVAMSGVLALGVGVLVTFPLAMCAWAHVYERTFKNVP